MKNSKMRTIVLLILYVLRISEAMDPNVDGKTRTSKAESRMFGKQPSSGLISFNSEAEKLHIDWAVTIPFVSIPLDRKLGENGEVPPLLHVNTKALGIVGLIATVFGMIAPLFSKTHPQYNYRSEDNAQWSEIRNTMNDLIFGNNYVAPCMQRVVCSIVSIATHAEDPTSVDKIIDGLSSHKWLKDATNGTIIQEAIAMGRKGDDDCARIYKDCAITSKLLKTMMNEFGIM